MRRFIYLAANCCAVLAMYAARTGPAIAESVVVTTVEGVTTSGELIDWNSDRIELSAEEQTVAFAPAELLELRLAVGPSATTSVTPHLELVDGSRLAFTTFTVADRVATVATPLAADPLKIPVGQIQMVQFVDIADLALPAADATGDSLAVLNKDMSDAEVLTGIIGHVSADQVEFTWEGDTIPVKRTKVAALAYFQKELSQNKPSDDSQPLCLISLASGNELAARQVEKNEQSLRITTVGGLELLVPVAEVQIADYSLGKLTYLSDLRPLKSKWTPLVEMPATAESIRNFGAPRMNMSFTGSPLALLWPGKNAVTSNLETYAKGLALRSRTEIEYRLPRGMRRFVAIAGMDPETRHQGQVLLRVEADGQTVCEHPIDGMSPPVNIDVDIVGKQRLKIFVDYGENLDLGDRLHLVEARLVK